MRGIVAIIHANITFLGYEFAYMRKIHSNINCNKYHQNCVWSIKNMKKLFMISSTSAQNK